MLFLVYWKHRMNLYKSRQMKTKHGRDSINQHFWKIKLEELPRYLLAKGVIISLVHKKLVKILCRFCVTNSSY